jgi:hypothetical protein
VYVASLCIYVFRKSNTPLQLVAVQFLWFGLSWFVLLMSCFSKIFDLDQKICSDINMVSGWMMLCEVVRKVGFSRAPINSELALRFLIAEPIEAHVHRLHLLGLNLIVNYSLRRCVIGLDWGAWLRMAHFGEYLPGIYRFLFCLKIMLPVPHLLLRTLPHF